MANTPTTTHTPMPPPAEQPPAKSSKEVREQRKQEEAEAYKKADDALYNRATGVMDDETREKLLALGADITRASPDPAQTLPDAVPGLTTTTGAHRSPIDPTTAAVPADEHSELVERMRGAPTVGSGRQHGVPEEHFKPRGNDPTKPVDGQRNK